MRFEILSLFALTALLPSMCSGAALPNAELTPRGDFEEENQLQKRKDVTVCMFQGPTGDFCAPLQYKSQSFWDLGKQ